MSALAKKTTDRLERRKPPVFEVISAEVSPGTDDRMAVRFETPCHSCFEFRLPDEFALELSSALERVFKKKAGLH